MTGINGNGHDDGAALEQHEVDANGQNEEERAAERAMPTRRDRLVGHEIEPDSRTEAEAEAKQGDDLDALGGVVRRDLEDEGAVVEHAPEHQGVDKQAEDHSGPKAPAPGDEGDDEDAVENDVAADEEE